MAESVFVPATHRILIFVFWCERGEPNFYLIYVVGFTLYSILLEFNGELVNCCQIETHLRKRSMSSYASEYFNSLAKLRLKTVK